MQIRFIFFICSMVLSFAQMRAKDWEFVIDWDKDGRSDTLEELTGGDPYSALSQDARAVNGRGESVSDAIATYYIHTHTIRDSYNYPHPSPFVNNSDLAIETGVVGGRMPRVALEHSFDLLTWTTGMFSVTNLIPPIDHGDGYKTISCVSPYYINAANKIKSFKFLIDANLKDVKIGGVSITLSKTIWVPSDVPSLASELLTLGYPATYTLEGGAYYLILTNLNYLAETPPKITRETVVVITGEIGDSYIVFFGDYDTGPVIATDSTLVSPKQFSRIKITP